MSGGGGDNDIEDTPEQKYLAQVAAEKWNFAQDKLAPLQNEYMQQVEQMDSPGRKAYIMGRANQGTQAAIGRGAEQLGNQAQAAGIDPSSGKFKGMMMDSTAEAASAGGEVAARAMAEQDNQKVAGLQNVLAIGSGQDTRALAGLTDMSSLSAQQARADAYGAFNRRASNLNTVGTLAGAGTRYYMNQPAMKSADQLGGIADQPLGSGFGGGNNFGLDMNQRYS